jgi:NTE family protein
MIRAFAIFLSLGFVWSYAHGGDTDRGFFDAIDVIRPDYGEMHRGNLDILPTREVRRPKVGLVLSGGGARGVAHLGVIEILEENGIPIDFIVGASMGSLIGGLYAVGYSTESIRALIDTTQWSDILSLSGDADRRDLFMDQKLMPKRGLFTLRFDGIVPVIPASLTPAQRLSSFINHLVLQGIYHPGETYDDLRIPFRTVATDLVSGERVVFGSGDLVHALRASISVPLLFSPVRMDEMLLVDGGLVSNIPVDVARLYGCDIVIAVNTTSGMRNADHINAPWEVVDQMVTIMQQRWNRDQLRLADIVITPPIDEYLGSDFDHLEHFIEAGRTSAEQAVVSISEKIDLYYASAYVSDTTSYRIRSFETSLHDPSASLAEAVMDNRDAELPPSDAAGDALMDIERTFEPVIRADAVNRGEIKRILNTLYRSGGYADIYVVIDETPTGSRMTLHASPNPRLRSVTFSGNDNMPSDTLDVYFEDYIGPPINNDSLRESLVNILSRYRSEGYSLARIDSTEFNETTGGLAVTIDEGTIGAIRYVGNRKTREYVIRREFPLQTGEVFRVDKAMQGIRNITGTGLFNQVMVNMRRIDDVPELIVTVDERYSELVRLSLRIDEVNHFQPMLELRNENLYGHGMEVGFTVGGGLRNRLYQSDVVVHRLFNTYLSSRVSAFYRFDDIDVYRDDPEAAPERLKRIDDGTYRQVKWGGNLTVGTQFERFGNVSAMLRYEDHTINERQAGLFTETDFRLLAYRLSSLFDTYDRYPFPREGVGVHAYYESALSSLGSGVSYSKFFVSYESYSTFLRRHTVRPRIQFGFGDETLPLSEQFFFGGKDQFYGLREYDSRGRQVFLVNLEYRFRLPFRILVDTYLHARYDVGSVWLTPQDIHLQDMLHGVGVGFGFDTAIVGPIEFSVGKAFQPRSAGGSRTGPLHTYFSIGYPLP